VRACAGSNSLSLPLKQVLRFSDCLTSGPRLRKLFLCQGPLTQSLSLTLFCRLTKSNFREPVNIGSDECVSMNDMAAAVMGIEGKNLRIKHIAGPEGVRGRNSDNTLIKEQLGWAPSMKLIVSWKALLLRGAAMVLHSR